MYSGFKFARFRNYRPQVSSGAWWLVMAPGLLLVFMAIAILVWPELLAYMVAFAVLFVGMALVGWGWSLRQAEQRLRRTMYNERNGHNGSDTVIYYEQ